MSYLYEKLASEIADQIEQGIFQAGERLPGVRVLSGQRSISPATAVAAYRKLEDDRFIEAKPRSGFFVRSRPKTSIPEPGISRPRVRPRAISDQQLAMQLIKAANEPNTVQLGAAVPGPGFLPGRAVERMIEAVDRHFPEGARVTHPQGGFVIWIELALNVDTFELSQQLLDRHISIAPGPIFSTSQKYRNFMRLSCAYEWSNRIERALATIARSV